MAVVMEQIIIAIIIRMVQDVIEMIWYQLVWFLKIVFMKVGREVK